MATTKPAAEKKTTTRTTAAKPAAEKKAPAKKAAAPKKIAKKAPSLSAGDRYKMIEVAAYYLAEKNGFSGNTVDYWIAAEIEIDKKLASK